MTAKQYGDKMELGGTITVSLASELAALNR